MNNISMARSYLMQAEERLKHAKEALDSGNYPYTIRQCQEAVELSLKAALRLDLPPEELYTMEDAKMAVEYCEFTLANCRELLKTILS